MPRKAASVTQAEVARSIRAAQSAGLQVVRVVVRPDGGVALETGPVSASEKARDEGRVLRI